MMRTQIAEFAERDASEQRCRWAAYGQAVVHLAWLRDDTARHLLFGMVELRPLEFPAADSSPEQCRRAAGKGGLYYRRFAMPVEEALAWYEAAIAGNLALPASHDNAPRSGRTLRGGPFFTLPAWPRLVVSNKLDFAADWMQGSPAHFLLTRRRLSRSQHELLRKPENSAQLKRWLHLDLVELYREYLGTICLIAPNPLFRSIEKSRMDEPRNGSVETVAYKLVARAYQSLNGIRLEVANENVLGRLMPATTIFSDDTAIKVFEFSEELDREGRTVTHPRHGLLCWSEPLPLIRTIQPDLGVESRRRSIEVPARGRHPHRYEYEIPEYQRENSAVVDMELDGSAIQSEIAEAQRQRARMQKAVSQRWIRDKPEDAAKFIRDMIGRNSR